MIYRFAMLPLQRFGLVFLTSLAAVAEIQTQHIFDVSAPIGRIEPIWHFRVRTKPQGGGVYQLRTGPIMKFDLKDRVSLIGGYFFTRAQEGSNWNSTHRPFGGIEVAASRRWVEVDARTMLERFLVHGNTDYFRFRNRIRFSPPKRSSPYISLEYFSDADGFRSVRYSAGVRRKFTKELSVDINYFYEQGRAGTVANRHMVGTTIHFRDHSLFVDSDP